MRTSTMESSSGSASPLLGVQELLGLGASGAPPSLAESTASHQALQLLVGPSANALNITEEDELKLLNFPNKREDLSTAIPLTVIFALLLVTGCIGNMCTAIVIARPKNKYMHTATNYYLFSLAMSDFLFLILGLPQEMYTLWQRYPYAFGESFCIIRGYLSEATTYASILTISAFTVERYVAICHPLWAHTMSQLPRAITSIVIIWITAAICAVPPAAELGIVTQRGPISNRTLEQSAQCATKRTIYENMFVASAIVFFIVPMIIVTVLYILIAIELRQSSKMNSAISKQISSAQLSAQSSNQPHLRSSGQHCQHQRLHHPHHLRHQQHRHAQHCIHHQAPRPPHHGHLRAPDALDRASASLLAGEQQHTGSSLMVNLLSQRPSSAIGNEQTPVGRLGPGGQACSGSLAHLQRSSACGYKWPHLVDLWPSQRRNVQQQLHECACHRADSYHANINKSLSQTAELQALDQAATRRHSPLSYHESLLHHAGSSADGSLPAKHLPVHSASSFSALNRASLTHSASCQSANPIRQHPNKQRPHVHRAAGLHGHQQHQNANQTRRSAAASSKKSVVRMLVVVSFFICWVPFHAQRLLASYLVKDENQNQLLLDIYLKLTYVSGVMYYLSSTINPLLYQLMSAKFRLAFKETFKCSLFRCARFGVGRTKMTASQQHSPTNSLKENQTNANGAHHRFNYLGNQQPCLGRLDSKSSQFSQSSTMATVTVPTMDCPACLANAHALSEHPDPQAYQSPPYGGPLLRLYERLNTSLMSLFRVNSNDARSHCGCSCCVICAKAGGNPSALVDASSSNHLMASRNLRHQHSSSPCGPSTPLLADQLEATPAHESPSAQLGPRSAFTFVRSLQEPAKQQQHQSSLTRLSSREEEQEPAGASALQESLGVLADLRMAELIQPTGEPGVEFNERSRCGSARPAAASPTTSDSCPASSSSSPDQAAHLSQSRQSGRPGSSRSTGGAGGARRNMRYPSFQAEPGGSSCSSNEPSSLAAKIGQPSASSPLSRQSPHALVRARSSSRRRCSLGSQQPAQLAGLKDQEGPDELHINQLAAAKLANSGALEQRRRKSSSSSAYQRHFSSSLSSSDRQLDKKLSLSTTTSALDDYTGSYTTTNSVLTSSNPNLLATAYGLAPTNSAEAIDEAAEETIALVETGSVATDGGAIQAFTVDNDLTDNLIVNELKLALPSAR